MSAKALLVALLLVMSVACDGQPLTPADCTTPPPFPATNLLYPHILTEADPTALSAVTYLGQESREMFDRGVGWITVDAHLFDATFDDGLSIEIQVNPELGTPEEAADFYARHLGRLPTALRQDLETVWIHLGDKPFSGFDHAMLIYTNKGDYYQRAGYLEETLAHEAAHVSLDPRYAAAYGWRRAQSTDPSFISEYACSFPVREDIAESFVAYLAARYRADRIPAEMRASILEAIPNRIAFFDALHLNMQPLE